MLGFAKLDRSKIGLLVLDEVSNNLRVRKTLVLKLIELLKILVYEIERIVRLRIIYGVLNSADIRLLLELQVFFEVFDLCQKKAHSFIDKLVWNKKDFMRL